MKIKILFHLNQVGYGGTEKAILTFCQNLDRAQFKPYLFIYNHSSKIKYYCHLFLGKLSKRNMQLFTTRHINSRSRLHDFTSTLGEQCIFEGQTKEFGKVVSDISPDIIHFNRGKWENFFDDMINRISDSTICVETNIFGYPASDNYFNRLAKTYFVSNWLLKKSPWSDTKGNVLYNPIKKPANQLSIRSKLEIPENTFVLGRISRPDLGDDNFILEVFNKIQQEKNQKDIYLLILAGTEIMRKAAEDNDNIRLISATTDESIISNFYNSIDLLLHYRIEGETFGMNIAEAMIHGKPVVSHLSHVDNAQAELLATTTQHGTVGYVARQNDQETYLKYITDLMDDPAELTAVGNNAKNRAQELFQEDVVTRYLEDEYLKLL